MPETTAEQAVPKRRGRPALPAEQRAGTFTIRLTAEQRAKLDALGGADWLRERIERAKLPAKAPAEA